METGKSTTENVYHLMETDELKAIQWWKTVNERDRPEFYELTTQSVPPIQRETYF
jgi:hypothetical protein